VPDGQDALVPKVLAEPKPSCMQHYLTQPEGGGMKLRHYGHRGQTQIRGSKRYWPARPDEVTIESVSQPDPPPGQEKPVSQLTRIRPVQKGTSFTWSVRFQNLHDWELGAVLWALQPRRYDQAGAIEIDRKYCSVHQVGMGKPLGLGSVRVEGLELHLEERIGPQGRYGRLFDENTRWKNPSPESAPLREWFLDQFEAKMTAVLGLAEKADFARQAPIVALLEMMDEKGVARGKREQMIVEMGGRNDFRDRRVLPGAAEVVQNGR
jgi:CRISPR-associated protein (TIGR03986 family)